MFLNTSDLCKPASMVSGGLDGSRPPREGNEVGVESLETSGLEVRLMDYVPALAPR